MGTHTSLGNNRDTVERIMNELTGNPDCLVRAMDKFEAILDSKDDAIVELLARIARQRETIIKSQEPLC